MKHLKLYEKFYNYDDIVWCGELNDDYYYEPNFFEYAESKSRDVPVFDTEQECQEWCDKQPQRIDLKFKSVTDKYNL